MASNVAEFKKVKIKATNYLLVRISSFSENFEKVFIALIAFLFYKAKML